MTARTWMITPLVLFCSATFSLAEKPKIVVDQPVFNWGKMSNSKSAEHEFVVKNTGDADLIIKNTKTTCGCTVAKIDNKTIPPGGSTKIKAKVNLKGRTGGQSKSVYVNSNDPKRPSITLTMKGTAVELAKISPPRIYLGTVREGKNSEKTTTISSGLGPFNITKLVVSSADVDTKVTRLGDGSRYRIHMSLKDGAPAGKHSSTIKVHTDIESDHVINIPISGSVVGALGYDPQKIILKENGGKPQTRYVTIRSGSTKKF
ncbi:MAG: DUF1573 domain-containing protein, partial [Verrucomicrobiota bacterium]